MKIEHSDIQEILLTANEIDARLGELAREIETHYADSESDLILLGVLSGATIVMSDFSRKLDIHTQIDWMSLSSYGSGTKSSGVVRVLKDMSEDVSGKDVLIVEDIIDSGVTLSWLVQNLHSRGARSVEIVTLLKKLREDVDYSARPKPRWVGFEIPDQFVVGYGLDYAGRYRTLPYVGVLDPKVYE